MQNNITAIIIF